MSEKNWTRKALSLGLAVAGLCALAVYWYSVHPPGFARGYTDDLCQVEQTRQMIAENLDRYGGPHFFAEQFNAPAGVSLPFMPWGVEISWIGAYFWKINRDLPFHWIYFGFSMAIAFLGVGWILRKMKLSPWAAWGIALVAVLCHLPRHFKIWHHYEHLIQHWIYWSFFLDALIWQRFWREKRWSWSLEAWRAFCFLGVFSIAGYYWGPALLELFFVRLFMWRTYKAWKKQGIAVEVDRSLRPAILPVALTLVLFVIDLRWFIPLLSEAWKVGKVGQGLGWMTPWWFFIRPVWLDSLIKITPFTSSETLITVGWLYWVPLTLGLWRVSKKKGGPGLKTAQPFLWLLGFAIAYASMDPPIFARIFRALVPFMIFFRVCCRWGLLMPPILGSIIVLCWPELSAWVAASFRKRPLAAWALTAAFVVSSTLEMLPLRTPVIAMPPMSAQATHLLEGIKQSKGTTVLDLPFCLAGGNGACTGITCPNYPAATTGACLRGWHDKNVYGASISRLTNEQCEIYKHAPYIDWIHAWRDQRCFSPADWEGFCQYLGAHTELSAVLLYPEIWTAAQDPACLSQFTSHLGPPSEEASLAIQMVRGNEVPQVTRLLRFGTHCN